MKNFILATVLLLSLVCAASAEDEKPIDTSTPLSIDAEQRRGIDPGKLFYSANTLYEKREYGKALEEYNKILGLGIDSGALYYNMGNSYFKLGKLGLAILYYAKARRLMPYDSDLKANLNYARSLVETSTADVPRKNPVVTLIKTPFRDFNFNTILVSALIIYLIFIMLQIAGIFNPIFAKKTKVLSVILLIFFIVNLGAFSIRYYDEKILHRGIVVQKDVECKYEPIDKSTTFYRLQEGDLVVVIKTRDGWRQVRRVDGKVGWVSQSAVEEI